MAGSAIGGFLVANVGIAGSAGVDALPFVVVASLIRWLRSRYPWKRADAEPVLRSIRRGFAHSRDAPVTRALVVSLLGLNLAVSPALDHSETVDSDAVMARACTVTASLGVEPSS